MAAVRHHRDGGRGEAGPGGRAQPPPRPRSLETALRETPPVAPGVFRTRRPRRRSHPLGVGAGPPRRSIVARTVRQRSRLGSALRAAGYDHRDRIADPHLLAPGCQTRRAPRCHPLTHPPGVSPTLLRCSASQKNATGQHSWWISCATRLLKFAPESKPPPQPRNPRSLRDYPSRVH